MRGVYERKRTPEMHVARFMAKVSPEPNTGCWLWLGATIKGYGSFWDGKKDVMAYRWSVEHATGEPIPAGMQIDHLCRQPACVNPDHLEVVTPAENTKRGWPHRMKPTCAKGHPYGETTHRDARRPTGKRRVCAVCNREKSRRNERRTGRRGSTT